MSATPTSRNIKLFESSKERREYDDLADLYTVLKTTQLLERAYVRDYIDADVYTDECNRLISQFKTAESAIVYANPQFKTEDFINEYRPEAPMAVERLLGAGVPATVLFSHKTSSDVSSVVLATEATQLFITAMDVLKLDQRAVDEVQPCISDLLKTLNKCEAVAPSFDKSKIQGWLSNLNSMRASQELDDDQIRQLILDLDTSYANFKTALSK